MPQRYGPINLRRGLGSRLIYTLELVLILILVGHILLSVDLMVKVRGLVTVGIRVVTLVLIEHVLLGFCYLIIAKGVRVVIRFIDLRLIFIGITAVLILGPKLRKYRERQYLLGTRSPLRLELQTLLNYGPQLRVQVRFKLEIMLLLLELQHVDVLTLKRRLLMRHLIQQHP